MITSTFRVSEEDWNELYVVPKLDEEMKELLSDTSSSFRDYLKAKFTYSKSWDSELYRLSHFVSGFQRMQAFQLIVLNAV